MLSVVKDEHQRKLNLLLSGLAGIGELSEVSDEDEQDTMKSGSSGPIPEVHSDQESI